MQNHIIRALINNNTTNKNKGWHAKKLLSYLRPTNYKLWLRTVNFMGLLLMCYLAKHKTVQNKNKSTNYFTQ